MSIRTETTRAGDAAAGRESWWRDSGAEGNLQFSAAGSGYQNQEAEKGRDCGVMDLQVNMECILIVI